MAYAIYHLLLAFYADYFSQHQWDGCAIMNLNNAEICYATLSVIHSYTFR